jgi:GTP-binding protein HflX
VNQTLTDIGASDKPVIMLFNKIDQYSHVKKEDDDLTPLQKENLSLQDLENTWMAKNHLPSIFISATEKTNLDVLKDSIYEEVLKIRKLRYPTLS